MLKRFPGNASLPILQETAIANSTKAIALVKKRNNISVQRENNGLILEIQGKEFSSQKFVLRAAKGSTFTFERKNYRGALLLVPDGSSILAVNEISIEDYLKGVLPAELGKIDTDSLKEAIKAFAVTARTFAVNKLGENRKLYDVEANVSSQVFFSTESEKPELNTLLEATKSQVLTFNGKPATVFFHSCCGGSTEDASNVFNATPIPYLVAHQDGDSLNCRFAPVYLWTESYSTKEFGSLLAAFDKRIDPDREIAAVSISGKFPSGRVSSLDVTFTDSSHYVLPAKQIRLAIKRKNTSGILRSSLFSVELLYNDEHLDSIIFRGKGNGHGVGLCQWGSFQMAKEGKSFEDILEFYFPGTKIEDLDEIN